MTWAPIDPETWGGRLKTARRAKKWRQEDLAKRVKVGYETVLKWERNQRWPQPENLDALAKLGGTFRDLAAEAREATDAAAAYGQTLAPAKLVAVVETLQASLEELTRRVAALEQAPARRGGQSA